MSKLERNTGFKVLFVARNQDLVEDFLEFPYGKRIFILGNSEADICLNKWDNEEKKKKINARHIQLLYIPSPISKWHILSLYGTRRGYKAVYLNGKHITARSGIKPLNDNDIIQFGEDSKLAFRLSFLQNPKNDCIYFEHPSSMITRIEETLKLVVDQLKISLPIECYKNNSIDWNKVYFSDLLKSVAENHLFRTKLLKYFGSQKNVKGLIYFLIGIRNVVFHPSKRKISLEEKQKLSSIYITLMTITNLFLE
jgi:hypothetical protein